jgi:hypothetical protein
MKKPVTEQISARQSLRRILNILFPIIFAKLAVNYDTYLSGRFSLIVQRKSLIFKIV